MDGNRFDDLLRSVSDGSRRAMIRAAAAALTISALTVFGGPARHDVLANKKHKNKKNKKKQTCPSDRPNKCGKGCCPATFPKCCDSDLNPAGKLCAPADATCCPQAAAGFCASTQSCCPPTASSLTGYCCLSANACCATDANCTLPQTCIGGCCQ